MDLISEHGIQLGIGLLGALLMFVGAYALPERLVVTLLIVAIPFQLIASRYGTVNVGMAYLTFTAFLLQGRIRHLPYLTPVLLIVFAYLLSMGMSIPSTYRAQAIYLVNIFANFLVFYLVYNHFRRRPDPEYALWLLVWANVPVLLFNAAQLLLGFSSVTVLGVGEWSIGGNLEDKRRLLGAFGPAGINASYHALQIVICAFAFMRFQGLGPRLFIASIALANFAFQVATGSRGGFLSLLFGLLLLLLFFRRSLGLIRILVTLTVGAVAMAAAAFVVVTFTPFDVLFARLAGTEFEGLVPDTRRGWFTIIERLPEAAVFGHGPRITMENMSPRFLREVFIGYPHNLYLFLLYSLGLVGFLAWMSWFATLLLHWWHVARRQVGAGLAGDLPRLGVVLLIMLLFDQMKVEFLRFEVLDFQQYLFTTWAMFTAFTIALAERSRQDVREAFGHATGSVAAVVPRPYPAPSLARAGR